MESTGSKLHQLLDNAVNASEKKALTTNFKTTECMVVSKMGSITCELKLEASVQKFNYLENVLTADEKCDAQTRKCNGIAIVAFQMRNKALRYR